MPLGCGGNRHGGGTGNEGAGEWTGTGNAHAGRGDALAALERDAEALEAYTRAVEINPEYAAAHAGRGDALAALGRHGEAQDAREVASRISSNAGNG